MIIRDSYKFTDTVQDSMAMSVGAFVSRYDGRPFLTIRVRNIIRYGGMFNFSFWGMNVQFYGISPDYSLHNSIIFGKKNNIILNI